MAKATIRTGKTSKRSAAPVSFYEVIFQGRPKVVRSFLAGLVLGAGGKGRVFYHFDAGIEHEGKVESLAELVGLKPSDCHAVVDAATGKLLKRLQDGITASTGLTISSCRHIRTAQLPFKFKVYAAQYQREITDLVRNLPPGLNLVDFVHDEKIDPSAAGPEAYAPVHDYEACGEGKIVGRVDLLIELRKKLNQQPLVEEGQIELRLA